MKVYAIKHMPTGAWMPARMFRASSGGWSHWIPGPAPDGWGGCDGFDKNPRIFFTWRSARNALTAWLRGPQREERHAPSSLEDDYWYERIIESPPVERKREDMAIVHLELRGV